MADKVYLKNINILNIIHNIYHLLFFSIYSIAYSSLLPNSYEFRPTSFPKLYIKFRPFVNKSIKSYLLQL